MLSVFTGAVAPVVKLSLVKRGDSRHPSLLMCSAYDFYPEKIKVSWLRDGVVVTSDVTSTEKMPNGDWYYQIHTELEYIPKAGEKISCMVEHAGFEKPMIYDWSVFRAPLKGAYMFKITVFDHGNPHNPTSACIMKNGQAVAVAYAHQSHGGVSTSNRVVSILEVGDVVFVRLRSNSRIYNNILNTFSGYLLFSLKPS
ncbi:H-2 class II histocompatibility E-S beta chain-like protein [Labeo rohita]|uniref:H-2 class II histocompatibility E-S beta chain-like protein n=1 Tax=Labeo rohita TaxID=84645 RepID=A0A498NL08_LABRO|nr:H-2 class II histocompatibility E-S beta chain-like protein [Labeo rohita]